MNTIKDYASYMKIGFSLCPDADREKIEKAFSLMESIGELLSGSEEEEVETILLFLDFYPFLSLCGCSSIASANLYPEDSETKSIGKYEVFKKVSLANHTLNGLITLNDLFSRITDTGLYLKVHSSRYHLSPGDYFHLLVAYLYHDVGKSPVILNSLGTPAEEYRKADHAFVSGQLLLSLKHELEEHQIKVSETSFNKIYLPVVSHHQKTTDPFCILLKYIDHKTREREMQSAGVVMPMKETEVKTGPENKYTATPEATKRELDSFWEIPDELFDAFYYGVIYKLLPKKRKFKDRLYYTYFHHPPNVYVASYHLQSLLRYITNKAGVMFPELENDENSLTIARQMIRKARERGFIKDPLFSKDLLAGWWYKVKLRNGETLKFFGFPLYLGDRAKPDSLVVEVVPMTREEIEEQKRSKRK